MKAILNNRVFQHIVFWCFYVLLYMGNYVQNGDYSTELLLTCIYLPTHLLFTYLQLYFLIPQFLLKKKILLYTLFTIIVTKVLVNISLVAYAFIIYPIRNKVPHPGMDWSAMWTVTPHQFKPVFALFMICG
ncbi:MAG TPA: hypothetical protein VLR49_12550, partial [Ferruginibacter sp.]|nr:hypothetical protein [Ferruginibacter sp.]